MEVLSLLQQAIVSDDEKRANIIRELTRYPDEVLLVAIDVLSTSPKSLWSLTTQIIRQIGYPKNATAIPVLIEHVADANSPARRDAIVALLEMDVHVVGSAFIDALLDQGQNDEFWVETVQGICSMLVDQAPYALAVLCGQTIAYLLSQPSLFNGELEDTFPLLFAVLQRIGSPCGVYAMPLFLSFMLGNSLYGDKEAVWTLLQSCSDEVKAPYQHTLKRIHMGRTMNT